MPLSRTRNSSSTDCATASFSATDTLISPASVNFTALLVRFNSTCPRRRGSPTRNAGTSAATFVSKRKSFARARYPTLESIAAKLGCNSKCTASRTSMPASILEKSRMSPMTPSRPRAAWFTLDTYPYCLSFRLVCRHRCDMPMMAFIGVRISWLMLARKSAFTRAPSVAFAVAFAARPMKTAMPPNPNSPSIRTLKYLAEAGSNGGIDTRTSQSLPPICSGCRATRVPSDAMAAPSSASLGCRSCCPCGAERSSKKTLSSRAAATVDTSCEIRSTPEAKPESWAAVRPSDPMLTGASSKTPYCTPASCTSEIRLVDRIFPALSARSMASRRTGSEYRSKPTAPSLPA